MRAQSPAAACQQGFTMVQKISLTASSCCREPASPVVVLMRLVSLRLRASNASCIAAIRHGLIARRWQNRGTGRGRKQDGSRSTAGFALYPTALWVGRFGLAPVVCQGECVRSRARDSETNLRLVRSGVFCIPLARLPVSLEISPGKEASPVNRQPGNRDFRLHRTSTMVPLTLPPGEPTMGALETTEPWRHSE